MAQNYTRQSSFNDGDTITASLFNDEYNQLVNSFTYSSTSASSTGHRHDGSAGQGGNIFKIGDLDFLNKIEVDSTNNRWGFYVEVSSAAVEQIRIQDGAVVPVTDNDIDLGTTSLEFKDLFIDGTAHIDTLDIDENATVAGTLGVTGTTTLTGNVTTTNDLSVGGNLTVTGTTTFNGGTITMGDAATDNVVFGADVDSNIIPDDDDTYDLGSSSQEWRNLYIDGTANIDSLVADTADINGGTIDGATIATSDVTVGSGKTLDVSAGTLTLADNQISGDKVEGGTIAATTITSLASTTVDTTNLEVTNIKAKDGASAGSIADSTGVVTLASSVLTTADINGGTIDGTVIGGTAAAAVSATTVSATGNITVGGTVDGRDVATDGAKLDGIESGATADQTDAEIRAAVEAATDSNVFTDADHTKLDAIEANATADQTASEIRTLVDSATDSNVFTDADHTKLDGIEASADVTDTVNVTAAGALMDSEVTNLAQVKAFDSADYATAAQGSTADSALQNVVEDTTPQLGGNLDLNSNNITGTGNIDVTGTITGSGDMAINTDTLFVDVSANAVGIGTSSPQAYLHVYGNNAETLRLQGNDEFTYLSFRGTVGTEQSFGYLGFANDTGTAADFNLTNSQAGGISFSANGSERMRISNGGNVGIGTSSPQRQLHVSKNANNTHIAIERDGTDNPSALILGANQNKTEIISSAAEESTSGVPLTFLTGNTERMRLDASGNVGIGTSSPNFYTGQTTLNINSAGVARLDLDIGNTMQGYLLAESGYTGLFTPSGSNSLRFGTNNTERMRIDSSGNVLVGHSSTVANFGINARLQVQGVGADTASISVTRNSANDNPAYLVLSKTRSAATGGSGLVQNNDKVGDITFAAGDGADNISRVASIRAEVDGTASANDTPGRLIFSTTPDGTQESVEAMRIDASQNLLVGKTSPSFDTVGAEMRADGRVIVVRNGDPMYVTRNGSNGGLINFRNDGSAVGNIGVLSSRLYIGSGDTGLKFSGADDLISPIDASDGTGRDNAIDLGSSGARFDDIYATNGTIQTSDRNEKQDIEALSDAEQRVAVAAKGLLRKFRWIDSVEAKGDDARIHFGIIAQDLQDAFTAEGLDAGRYAMFTSTTWTDEETGEERSRMGVRYSELLAFIIAAI